MAEKVLPHPPSHVRRDRCLTVQATLLVEPADKFQPLEFRSGFVVGSSLIKFFESEKAHDLLARKTHVLEIPNFRSGRELLL
jgi:hypothetical protein